MAFHWVAPDAAPELAASVGLPQEFPTRADAEGWLTASWQELAEAGIDEVVLLQDDHVVYGPMSLHP